MKFPAEWLSDYDTKRPDQSKLQMRVDKFMEIFDENERKVCIVVYLVVI